MPANAITKRPPAVQAARDTLRRLGWSQKEAAERLGVTREHITIGGGASGRLDQSAGTLATGEGNWLIFGYLGAQSSYNLTGSGSLKVGGLSTPNGNVLLGLDAGTVSTWTVNTTGTVEAGGIFASGAGASTGIINMDAGTVNVSGEIQIGGNFFGHGGTGQLIMTGGDVTAPTSLVLRGAPTTPLPSRARLPSPAVSSTPSSGSRWVLPEPPRMWPR